ncbi:restriction endonuclease subunit S [Algoriphagus sp. NBT04N3]|jgi:type I restriction enzyme, S subunit|uniref:restriction endonuclease subunit S n=1 Tax=Algoriphagus sp. NBT04N3 TaxID=2705473 RepID=UPI001C625203|nr:restriction endonuclease subunit S [Algoriphagus sp. NBT04N3]QYH37619.1 restriction endonuclease subunit S [Algoriphagus sp. NBT04N3]
MNNSFFSEIGWIPESAELVPLGELLETVIDHRGKTPKKLGGDWEKEGIPAISAKNVHNGVLTNKDDIRCVSKSIYKKWMKEDVKRGDILLASEGATMGEYLYWDYDYPIVLSQRLFCLRADNKRLNSKYLYAFIRSESFQKQLSGRATGTSVFGVRQSTLLEILVPIIDYKSQEFIGNTIYQLEKKIDLNRQMNQTLEAMAQCLFNSWFVDFDPVVDNALQVGNEIPEELQARAEKRKGLSDSKKLLSTNPNLAAQFPASFVFNKTLGKWIPEEWEVKSFGDEFNITMGQSPPGTSYNEDGIGKPFFQGKTDFGFRFPINRIYCTDPKREARKNDTLISVRAPVGNANLASSDCIIGRGLCAVRHASNSISFTYYSVLQLKEVFDVFEGEGTVFGSINQTSLKGIPLIKIPNRIIESFEKAAGKLDQKIETNTNQTETLTQLRDRLLPELISGRVRVKDSKSTAINFLNDR